MRKLSTTMKVLMLMAAFIWPALHGNGQSLIISELVDGPGTGGYPKYVEITNVGTTEVDLNGINVLKSSNGAAFASAYAFAVETLLPAGESMVVCNMDNTTSGQLWSEFSLTTPTYVVHGATNVNGNGDDAYAIATAALEIIDIYGSEVDGSGLAWDYLDTYAYRNNDIGAPATTFDAAEWTILPINTLDGETNLSTFLTPGTHTFSSGTPDAEPTNHVTAFAAVADDASSITLTWEDNDGAQAASSFLIMASTGAPATPADATPVADDTDLSDGEGAANVAHGAQTYTFTGLTASTEYNFAIYPYTNSGADIDFLTDATVPTASATTDVAVIAPEVVNIVIAPEEPTSTDAVSVSADITDADGTIASVTLNWGTVSGTLGTAINMSLSSGDTYVTDTDIPAQLEGTDVYYEIVAVDNSTNTTTTSEQSYTIPVAATTVADIATLRAGATDGTVYELTSEAIITYQRASRSQKYIEDATGGILIDDNAGTITTVYNQYDGITGVTGTLSAYNGVLQFIPTADPGAATSTGNTVTPQTVLVTDITGDVNAYESELVTLENITFADAGGTFASGQNYTITDGTNTITFRTGFSESDIIDATIPSGPQNITALVAEFNGTAQVYARDLADIAAVVSNDPIIFNVAATPASPTSSDAVSIAADVTDADGTIASVTLNWGTVSGTLSNAVNMTLSSGDTYVADTDIPAQADGTTVYYAITAEDDGANQTVTDEASYTVTDITATQVADIATLRAGATDGTVYELTGEAVITYQRASRNQKYIEDATAGILIDDNAGNITTVYNQYDGITGVTGTLSAYNGVLQFIPTADPGAATSTGNTVTPQVVLATDITGDVNAYESELVTLENMTFADAGGTFGSGQNYTITDGTNTITFRTGFSESDIIDATIPTGSHIITALVAEYNGTPQIYARDLADIAISNDPQIANVAITPAEPTPADAVSVSADVTDADGTIASVVLKWGTATSELTNEIIMSTLKGSYVTDTDIPAQADGTTVYYTITATDNASNETVTDEMNYQVLDLVTPTQLVITTVAPASPFVGQTFSVTVEAQDAAASAGDVTEDTEVQLTLATGTGTISGTLTGTITAGTSSITISGLSYDVVETIEINAAVVTGMALTTSANAEIIVTEEPDGPIVFFSEYSEAASGNNKYVEVYNATGTDIDLTGVVVKLASNGGDWGNNIALTGTLASEEVFVIANSGAAQEILDAADATSNITYFNGNDAVGLFVNDVLVDIIGVQGVDPTTGWAVAGVADATKDHTLIRKFPDVTMGNIDWAASAGTDATDSEWIVADWDDYSNIGWHGAPLENPVIANIAITPDMPTSTDAVSVSADVTSPNGTITSVVLKWGTTTGELTNEITMSSSKGSYVTDTDIPAQADGTMVYYTITATDDASLETVTNESIYTVNDPSLVTLPYSHDFTDNNFGELVTYSVTGAQLWEVATYGNPAPGAKITGFAGSNNDNEDWMITPGLDFSGVTEAKLVFDEAINYANNIAEQQQILASTDYSGTGDPSNATWDVLTVTGRSTGDNWNFVTVNDVDLSTYAGENVVYIAFKYSSSTTYGATWEVDNIMVEEGGALIAPVIENIATSPAEPTSSDVVTVSATITDANGTVESAILHWGTDVFYGNTIDMAIESGDTWVAETAIPAQANNTRVFFKIIATDNESNATTSDDMTYYSFDPYAGVLPYFEPFYYGLGTMSETSVDGAQTWRWDEYGYAKVSGYAGSAQVNEDWLITPSLDLTTVESAVLNFREAINYAVNIADEQKVMISTDYDGSSAPASATWTELTVTNRPAGNSWTFNQVGEIDLTDYVGEASVYIAFKYISTTAGAATWEIDAVSVSEGGAIIFGGANQLNVYPNPAHSELFVTGAANAQVEVITLSGQVVMSTQANDNRIDVSNLNNGLYIVRVIDGNEVYTTRFVKE